MATRSERRPKRKAKRGLIGTIGLACGGLVAVGMVGLLVIYAVHRPTFDKIGTFFGTVQRGMVVTFWQDVAHKTIDDASLGDDERVAGHDTVNKLAYALREGRGTDEQRVRADEAAHAFIEQFEEGDISAAKLRPVLEEAEAALAVIEAGDESEASKKKSNSGKGKKSSSKKD